MAFSFHNTVNKYFDIQEINSRNSLIPFLADFFSKDFRGRILEIGCHFGGNLFPFIEDGWSGVGVDLNEESIEQATEINKKRNLEDRLQFIVKDIFEIDPKEDDFFFDLIVLKDVIEHIENKQKFIEKLTKFLKPNGKVFIAFPPWYMPFGGHQQGAKSFILSRGIFLHLLPMPLYLWIFKVMGEESPFIDLMKETKERGLLIERFNIILKELNLRTVKTKSYFVAPIYKYKFGLKTRELWSFLTKFPFIRNFYTTSIYYILEKQK